MSLSLSLSQPLLVKNKNWHALQKAVLMHFPELLVLSGVPAQVLASR